METVEPGKTKIGWVGLGVMGRSMCRNLMNAGFSATVFTRTQSKAKELVDSGAVWVESPGDVARQSDVIFTIVGFPQDVRDVILGTPNREGVLDGCDPGAVVVDMTTSKPSLAAEISKVAAETDVHSIDAPVSGGDVGAQNGTLSIMIGGPKAIVDALGPCWAAMGSTIVHQGPAGAGQHCKMVNQTLIATGMIGVCEALLYAWKSGLDLQTVLKSVSSGAAGSWSLSNLAPRIIDNNFEPGFYVEHFIKDMGIALEEANRMGLSLPGLSLANQLYIALQAQGGSRMGTQALQRAMASLSGVEWESR